ncbi:MAG: hypothetical protein C0456_18945 [Hyphomonas sp.]|uniref:hypothetical protein n=1 Tax=Hyphomonas sp. TaxID=87 RepID=UPI001D5AED8F|nr:hypothetical protein [Hyphomonas sp.]MBA4228686.1 hypothetical protein [Hyphomonas sp.]
MTNFSGTDALQALTAFAILHGNSLPTYQRDFLANEMAGGDLLRRIIVGMEVLYASRGEEDFPEEGVSLLDGLARFVSQNNFYGLGGLEGRATKIALVAQRLLEDGDAVAEDDIEPSTEYVGKPATEGPTPTV